MNINDVVSLQSMAKFCFKKRYCTTTLELRKLRHRSCTILILGCGGHTRSIINIIKKCNKNIKIIIVDKNARENEYILGCPVYKEIGCNNVDYFIASSGDNTERNRLYIHGLEMGIKPISVISPEASISEHAQIGDGCFISSFAYIEPSVVIGNNVIVQDLVNIGHDVEIGVNSFVGPSAVVTGKSKIGNNCFLGANCTVTNESEVCDNVVIGAGSLVIRDIVETGLYVGSPAHKRR